MLSRDAIFSDGLYSKRMVRRGPQTYEELLLTQGGEGQRWRHPSGAIYAWSEAAQTWLRSEAQALANGNAAIVQRIRGSVLPSAESPAWTHDVDGSGGVGTITVVDGWVVFNTMSGAVRSAIAFRDHNIDNASWQLEGRFQVTALGTTDSAERVQVTLLTGEREFRLNLAKSDTDVRIVNFGNTALGTQHQAEGASASRFILALIDRTGTVKVWFDHKKSPSLSVAFTGLPVSSAEVLTVGDSDLSSDRNATLRVQALRLIRLT